MMDQTRIFLLVSLLVVGYLLFLAWQRDYAPPHAQSVAALAFTAGIGADDTSVPSALLNARSALHVPLSTSASNKAARSQLIHINTDVLHLEVDTRGGSIVRATMPHYLSMPVTKTQPNPPPTVLLDHDSVHFFVAQNGLVSSSDPDPKHQPSSQAIFQTTKTSYAMAPGQNTLAVEFTWRDDVGIEVTKTYTFKRNSYVIELSQRIDNHDSTAWTGNPYQQLVRAAPPSGGGWIKRFTDPSSRAFTGGAWYNSKKFETLAFKDFSEPKDRLDLDIKGGWAAMLQLYFVAAWIPPANQTDHYMSQVINPDSANPHYLIRAFGPSLTVAPGQQVSSTARLYLGPNVQGSLNAVAPGLNLAIDYGMFKIVSVPMHWLLAKLHALTRNWGLAIILLVLIIKGATWKLTAVQYGSSAKMRRLAPRVSQLKELYGDDKVKMQQVTMELYKKEKVNPMGGCLPMLITMPVFYGLYKVLESSLELRHAPFLWIPDLGAADPYYILPIIYATVMLGTQWLNPAAAGMDPNHAKMMKVMPLLLTAVFAFFPAGLCLYYAVNGLVGLGQQWWVIHDVERMTALTII